MTNPDYLKAVAEIDQLQSRGIHRGLEKMEAALRLLRHPEQAFPTVHIAGTNGKGSTCAMVAHLLKKASFRVGLTISPHVVNIRERIQVGGRFISEEDFAACHQHLKKMVGHLTLTYFEWITLMAFLHFARSRVEIAVLETGMGGRWDATNVTEPLVAAITNISLDHELYLGSTIESILEEKLPIIKKGAVVLSGVEQPHLQKRIRDYCLQNHNQLSFIDDSFRDRENADFDILNYRLSCRFLGAHQKRNAALAVMICHALSERGYRVSPSTIQSALMSVSWPGRLEQISQSPLIVLDGAHNLAGIEALAKYLQTQKKFHILFGPLSDRPVETMARKLMPYAATFTWAHFEGTDRALTENQIIEKATGAGEKSPNLLKMDLDSWKNFVDTKDADSQVLVTGSLALVSLARSYVVS